MSGRNRIVQACLIAWFLGIPMADSWVIGMRDALTDDGNLRATLLVLGLLWCFGLALFVRECERAPVVDDDGART